MGPVGVFSRVSIKYLMVVCEKFVDVMGDYN